MNVPGSTFTVGQSFTVVFTGGDANGTYEFDIYPQLNGNPDYNSPIVFTSVNAQGQTSKLYQGGENNTGYLIITPLPGNEGTNYYFSIYNSETNDENTSFPYTIQAPATTPVFCNTVAYVTELGAGANDGSSWDNALPGTQLAQALSTACANTTFLVGSGLYKPTTGADQTASFSIASGVQVYGGYVVSGNTGTRETFVVGTPASTTFSGDIGTSASTDNSYRVVEIIGTAAGTRLDGIVITGGRGEAVYRDGGGIYSSGASFTLANATLTDNAANHGGSVYMQAGALFVTGTSITRSTASVSGGGIYFASAATLELDNSILSENVPGIGNGGAVFADNSLTVSVTSSTIGQNSASSMGGAFMVNGSVSLVMTGSKVVANSSTNSAGGVFKVSGGLTATITSSSISQNTSNSNGAVFDVSGAVNLRLTSSAFIENISRTSSGAVVNGSGGLTAVVTSCSISQNSTSYGGGFANVSGLVSLTISDSDLRQNNCTSSNGGFVNANTTVNAVINNTQIRQNVANSNGGVFNTGGSMILSLSNSSLTENIARSSNGGAFNANSLTAVLTSCTISQNTANSNGGVFYSQGVTALTVTNGDVFDNVSKNSNGGFLYSSSQVDAFFDNVRMERNKANSSGGAVYSSGVGTVSANNSVFNQNQVTQGGNGGVFYFSTGTNATITSSSVTQNSAPGSGAAIYGGYQSARLVVDNSLFSQNQVTQSGNGGFMYVSGPLAATITSTTMSQNTSPSGGAAIAASSGSTTFVTDNSYYTGNIVTQGGTGGALYLSGGITSIKNSVFTGNTCPNPGGAIYIGSQTSLTMANTLVKQNVVWQNGPGGAIYLGGATGSITSTTISQNTAVNGQGGGLYITSANDLTISNSLVDRNVSTGSGAGGGIYLSGTSARLDNLTVTQNTVTQNGGGIYLSGSGTLSNCVITQNTAVTGGGISVDGTSYTLINNLLIGNTASESGGAILTSATVNAINQTISGNSAPTGSAVTVLGTGVLDLKNSIVWNNATPANSFSVDATASLSLTNSLSDLAATGFGNGGNNKTGDPLFMNAATGDFTLKACSPAINAGADAANTTTTDLAGLNRKAGTIDMGAYEFQGAALSLTLTAAASKTLACTGEILPLTATLSGGTSPNSYSWTTNSTGVTLPSSATGSPLSVTLTGAGQKSFTVTGQDAGGCAATPVVVSVSVVNGVSITAQPAASSAVCAGTEISVPVSVTGDVVSQQWYKNGSPVMSQTATTLSLTATTADAGNYQLIIETSGCGSLTSSTFSLTVSEVVAISAQPAAASAVCVGMPVSVPVSVTGMGASYQWYKDGSPVNGQATATLSLPSATTTDAGSYSLVITGGCNSVTSSAFSLTVNAAPVVAITPSTTTIGGGQSATLTASGATSYTWSTGSNLTAISVSPTQETVYTVTGNSNGCIGTATATVSVTCNSSVVADAVSMTQNLVLGGGNCAVSLQGYGFGSAFTVTGPNGYVFSTVYRRPGFYTVNALNVTQPGTYSMKTSYTDACGRVSTDTVTYVVTGEACK